MATFEATEGISIGFLFRFEPKGGQQSQPPGGPSLPALFDFRHRFRGCPTPEVP